MCMNSSIWDMEGGRLIFSLLFPEYDRERLVSTHFLISKTKFPLNFLT
jgi:hypothetical protein